MVAERLPDITRPERLPHLRTLILHVPHSRLRLSHLVKLQKWLSIRSQRLVSLVISYSSSILPANYSQKHASSTSQLQDSQLLTRKSNLRATISTNSVGSCPLPSSTRTRKTLLLARRLLWNLLHLADLHRTSS